jgi:hypothetical protein
MTQIKSVRIEGYDILWTSYSGSSYPLGEQLTKEEASNLIRERLRLARRKGKPVAKIDKGRWEIQTPEEAGAISESEGFLTLIPCRRRYRVILGRRVWLS